MKEKLLGLLLSTFLKLWVATLRKHCIGLDEYLAPYPANHKGQSIITFWHGHQILMPFYYTRFLKPYWPGNVFALISEHGDGRIAAHTVEGLGIKSTAGSSSRGGARAFLTLVKHLRAGDFAAITPDGPRGPLHEVKPGVIQLSAKSQVAIMPVAVAARRAFRFGSWDKMFLPYPFTKVVFVVGEEMLVPKEISDEETTRYAIDLTERLNEITRVANDFVKE